MPRARPQDYVSDRVEGLGWSAASIQLERARARAAQGAPTFAMAFGQSPFPVPERMVEALRAAAGEKSYLPAAGLPELRRALAGYLERRLGIDRTAEDVVVGPGTKELAFLLRVAFSGELLVPTPGWSAYEAHGRLLGAPVRPLHTRRGDAFMLTPEFLDHACAELDARPRMLVLTYPGSPTGQTYRSEQLRELARVCEKHDLLVLADEIYAELHHKGLHTSMARWYPDRTIVMTGLSKWMGAGGWRLGALAFPATLRHLLDATVRAASETHTSTSAPIQHAARVAFEGGEDIEDYLVRVRRVLAAAGRWSARRLSATGVLCAQPVGAFYVFPDFEPLRPMLEARGIKSGTELCQRVLDETGVALLPGAAFGRPEHELSARMAYVDFDGARALGAVAVIPREQPLDETFLRRHCPRVVDAVRRLVHWLEPTKSNELREG